LYRPIASSMRACALARSRALRGSDSAAPRSNNRDCTSAINAPISSFEPSVATTTPSALLVSSTAPSASNTTSLFGWREPSANALDPSSPVLVVMRVSRLAIGSANGCRAALWTLVAHDGNHARCERLVQRVERRLHERLGFG